MGVDVLSKVSDANLPKIRGVARDGAVQRATGSLAAWGAINLGLWLFLGGEDRVFLGRLVHPNGGIYLLLYGGLALAAVMLAGAAFGATSRSPGTIFLDGLSLVGVGLWNVCHDFIASAALQPYGYTVKNPSTIWIVLGISQLIWGFRQFAAFQRMSSWPVPVSRADLVEFRKELQSFVKLAEDPQSGIVKAKITVDGPLGLGLLSRTTAYTGALTADRAILISTTLDDCLAIHKAVCANAAFGVNGTLQVRAENSPKTLALSPLSVLAFKTWTGSAVQVEDLVAPESSFSMRSEAAVTG